MLDHQVILLARDNILQNIRRHFNDARSPYFALEVCTPRILPQQEKCFDVIRLAGHDKKPWARDAGLAHQSDINMRFSALKHKVDMFQVSHCFRAETEDSTHLNDFQMLEIIRVKRRYGNFVKEIFTLIKGLSEMLGIDSANEKLKMKKADESLIDEIFWGDLEVASCYTDILDPHEIRETYGLMHGIDDFINLVTESPPTMQAGIGIDRLIMAFYGIKDIHSVSAATAL